MIIYEKTKKLISPSLTLQSQTPLSFAPSGLDFLIDHLRARIWSALQQFARKPFAVVAHPIIGNSSSTKYLRSP